MKIRIGISAGGENLNPDAMVACLPTCVSSDRPTKYTPITGADFLRSRLEPTYAKTTYAETASTETA